MQYKLLFSKLRSSVEGPSFLETIRSSSSGEYPHRAVAMEQIFERRIQDRRERMLAQARNPSQQEDPVVQPNSSKKETPTAIPTAQPTTARPPPPATNSETAIVQQFQALQTQEALPTPHPSQVPSVWSASFRFKPTTQSTTQPSTSDKA